MDDALLDLVLDRLDRSGPSADATDLVVAACQGSDCLENVLGGAAGAGISSRGQAAPIAAPAGAYLKSITVRGFRGVGAESTLSLTPGPGLTVVSGRNGSGKSSFAEGLELLLTGKVRRWDSLTAVWSAGWRNMHIGPPTEIAAEMYIEDHGSATARRVWDRDVRLEDGKATVQIIGEKRAPIEALGWETDLVTLRPFLAHTELEAFLGRPSDLYEIVASVLNLGDLVETLGRLAQARKPRELAMKVVQQSLTAIRNDLAALDDPRALACQRALAGRSWDLDAAEAIATGTSDRLGPPTELDRLRGLAQLTVPSEADIEAVAAGLEAAADGLAAVANTNAARAANLSGLLHAALRYHDEHGDGPCPVCRREAALDDLWRTEITAEVTRLDQEAKSVRAAQSEVKATRNALTALAHPVPTMLADDNLIAGIDLAEVRAMWRTWATPPPDDDPDRLRNAAANLRVAHNNLTARVAHVSQLAAAELAARDDAWSSLAARIATWCTEARKAQSGSAKVVTIREAETWLKDALDEIRNLRLQPLADGARAIWSDLRQESNVELGALRLLGSATRRQLAIDVTIDGSPGGALGVMSQGEVNALALSIFIPRATMPQSPFRFLVLDDPVQAMDPAKVDGLARVLDRVAQDRQVIVFTHDDRLPQAIRSLDIKATVLEVARRPRSAVEIRQVDSPRQRALNDAWAISKELNLDDEIKARLVGGFCRVAAEVAFVDAARHLLLKRGGHRMEVETQISEADSFTRKAALALFQDRRRTSEVVGRLGNMSPRHVSVYKELRKAGHKPISGKVGDLIRDTWWFTDELASRLR